MSLGPPLGLLHTLQMILVLAAVSGCQSFGRISSVGSPPRVDCLQLDWFELGRSDGAQGEGIGQIQSHLADCTENKRMVDPSLYEAGHAVGLNEYCTPVRGFEAGRNGQTYAGICPWHLSGRFLIGFRLGERARSLEARAQAVRSAIETELTALPAQDRRAPPEPVAKRIDQLERERAELRREIEQIESELTQTLL